MRLWRVSGRHSSLSRQERKILAAYVVCQNIHVLAVIALAGCATVGSDYVPPRLDVPAQWTVPLAAQATNGVASVQWWHSFHDSALDNLVEDALAANVDLATAQQQLREARAARDLARAQPGPSIDIAASRSHSNSRSESGNASASDLYSAGFDASWEIDIFGGLRRGAQAAQADLDAATEVLRNIRISIIAEVVLNYIDLRVAESRLVTAKANLASSKETVDLVSWRHKVGLVSALDVAQSRVTLESQYAAIPALEAARAEAFNRIAVLTGLTAGELRERVLATATIPLADNATAVGIPADVLRQRPDVRASERQLAAEVARLGQAQAARYPSFQLSGSLGLEATSYSALRNGAQTRSLIAGITAPIFDAGRIKSNIEIQDARVEQARLAYRETVLSAVEEVENALAELVSASERRARLVLAVESARDALKIAQYEYAGGLNDFLSVLDSQRTVFDLDDQLVTSTGQVAVAQIHLSKALGRGWNLDLGQGGQ